MEGRFDFEHPQIISFIMSEALHAYEKALGSQNELNVSNLQGQLRRGTGYIRSFGRNLLPKGVYQFNIDAHFHPTELKAANPCCELVLLLSQAEKEEERLPLLKTAVMDGARQYIAKKMLPCLYKACTGESLPCISSYFGPGLFSTELSEMGEYYRYLQVTPDLALLKGDMLVPLSSFIGAIYGLEKAIPVSPCAACKGLGNCQFCMIDHEK